MPASPAQSPIRDNLDEDLPLSNGEDFSEGEEYDEDVQEEEEEELSEEYEEDSDQSPSSSGEENDEFITVDLADLRRDVQCPICLEIIRKTKAVMECLHRFCKECIDKAMRVGNKECPTCRTHCASRRSLREDPIFDRLIAVLYPDIDQYEAEELAYNQEEDARNKQIQASIAETLRRQTEALTKKRKRSQSATRKRANYCSNDDEGANSNGSSAEEGQEARRKRSRRLSQRSPAADMVNEGLEENDLEADRDNAVAPGALAGNSEMLVWGGGGARSQSRHGNAGGSISRLARSNRLARLAEHLKNMDASTEVDIHIILVSLDTGSAPRLQQPYLCCNPALSIRQISEFIAYQTALQVNNVEILAVKELRSSFSSLMSLGDIQPSNPSPLDAGKDELLPLDFELSLQAVKSKFIHKQGRLILAYRQKSLDH